MSPDLNDQLARIQALLSIETADTSAVFSIASGILFCAWIGFPDVTRSFDALS
jgi:hypothetical protein